MIYNNFNEENECIMKLQNMISSFKGLVDQYCEYVEEILEGEDSIFRYKIQIQSIHQTIHDVKYVLKDYFKEKIKKYLGKKGFIEKLNLLKEQFNLVIEKYHAYEKELYKELEPILYA